MVLVFFKNKLVSVDTILAVLIELKEKYNTKIYFIVFEEMAYSGIRSNIVINDAVNYAGHLTYIGLGVQNRLLRRLIRVSQLMKFYLYSLFGAKIIHFGALDRGFLNKIFSRFKGNIFFSQSSSFNHSPQNYILTFRDRNESLPLGESLIAYTDDMRWLKMDGINKRKVFKFGPTRIRGSWLKRSYYKAEEYFDRVHPDLNYKKGYFVIILSTLGEAVWLSEGDTAKPLLVDILEALSIVCLDKPILIKPHVTTDLKAMNSIIEKSRCKNIQITYLHPSVLSKFAYAFIGTMYSSTFADAISLGVETIEYTNYNKKTLKATNNRSVGHEFVTYFINNNKSELQSVLNDIKVNKPVVAKNQNYPKSYADSSGLLESLSS
jgi:hypothetical protein